jgi:hypothetical protein
MCTYQGNRRVLVCDVAIARVRQEVSAAFGTRVRYTPVDGRGTLVEAEPGVDADQFTALMREAITRTNS